MSIYKSTLRLKAGSAFSQSQGCRNTATNSVRDTKPLVCACIMYDIGDSNVDHISEVRINCRGFIHFESPDRAPVTS